MDKLIRHSRRFFADLLIVAIVYQAGACPCGCWDHSLWGDTVGRIVDGFLAHRLASTSGRTVSAQDPVTSESPSGRSQSPSMASHDDHDCDRAPALAERHNHRQNRSKLEMGLAVPPVSALAITHVTDSYSQLPESIRHRAPARSSPPLLQVFRL